MNQMTTVGAGGAVATTSGYDPFAAYGQEAAAGSGNFLKFSKGEWLLGQNGDELELGHRFVANMGELSIGWIRWGDGKPQERRMGLLPQGFRPETRDALGYMDQALWETDKEGKPVDPWTMTNELPLVDLSTGEQVTFSASSKGGIGGIGNLCKAYGREYRLKGDLVPVIELQRDSYMHPVYKKTYVPVLNIVDWIENSGVPSADEREEKPEPEPAAKAKAATGGRTRF